MRRVNWAGNHVYRARALHRPATLEQVREIVASAPRIRVLGSAHSFTAIGDSDELLSLEGLPPAVAVDREAATVSFGGGVRYGELAEALRAEGLALANLASLPHISVAGAVSTATHGSGDERGNLATAVAALELVTSAGELVTAARGDPDFDGMVVGLGALGALTRLTLDVEPAYEVRQHVFEGLSWEALLAHYDEISAAGYSVSVFTRWGEEAGTVWIKSREGGAPEDLFGARPATTGHHPIPGLDPVHTTPQLGVPGPWWDRLPHFRLGFTPSSGDELQSELFVARRDAAAAVEALRSLAGRMRPLLQVAEMRTIAADRLWMSPQHARDSVGFHFTWQPRQEEVEAVLVAIEAALSPFRARPHWGKLFAARAQAIAPLYERTEDFAALAARLDPRGAFRNAWLEERLLGRAAP